MSPDQDPLEGLIWATRGRSWGYRFLLNGGLTDPLVEYERIFAHLGGESTAWRRADGKAALRFPDPEGRRDAAGRVIPHEFVVFGDLADEIESVEDGLKRVWPLVAAAYDRVWALDGAPSIADLHVTTDDDPPLVAPQPADSDRGDPW